MQRRKNPFTPSFGVAPLVFAGREALIDDLLGALDAWPGDPLLSTIVVGARGTGKTSLLTVVAQEAASKGWVSANVSAAEGMLEDIIERATEAGDAFVEREADARVKGVTVAQIFGVEWEYRKPQAGNWRTRMNRLLDALSEHDIGLYTTKNRARLVEKGVIATLEDGELAFALPGMREYVSGKAQIGTLR